MNIGNYEQRSIVEEARKYLPNPNTYDRSFYMVQIRKPMKAPDIITDPDYEPGPTMPYEPPITIIFVRKRNIENRTIEWVLDTVKND